MKAFKLRFTLICFLFAASAWFSNDAIAQSEGGGIVVTGTDVVEVPAELMRMTMKIEGKGESFKKAMEALAQKKKKAMIKLEKLGAIEDSIQFAEQSTGQQSDTSEMITQMRRSFGNDPRVANMMKVKPPVSISTNVTADWKLEGAGDELLLACDSKRKEITDVDVGGKNEEDQLSEEQQELAEELKEMMSQYGGGYGRQDGQPAGEAKFHYVARFTAEQIDQVTANAFSNAKTSADNLARSAGVELGVLRRLSQGTNPYAELYQYDPYGNSRSAPTNKTLDDGTIEVVGTNPQSIKYSGSVITAFEIKAK